MQIKSAKFYLSSQNIKDCPKSMLPEYAFIGRSNVGKSSLINMIANQKKLASLHKINSVLQNHKGYGRGTFRQGFPTYSGRLNQVFQELDCL